MWGGERMALKRMFSLSVTDTDKFLDMSVSAQALYFHLGMHGDDDGFVSSPRKIARGAGCNDDDLRLLASKGYIIPFESGVIVIADWNINNTLKNDRYHKTVFSEERALISEDSAGRWVLGSSLEPARKQIGSNLEPEHNGTEPNVTKQNRVKKQADKPPRAPRFTPPTLAEVQSYVAERHSAVDPQGFIDFYAAKGWLVGKAPMRDWKAACRNAESWERWAKQPNSNRIRTSDEYAKGADFFG